MAMEFRYETSRTKEFIDSLIDGVKRLNALDIGVIVGGIGITGWLFYSAAKKAKNDMLKFNKINEVDNIFNDIIGLLQVHDFEGCMSAIAIRTSYLNHGDIDKYLTEVVDFINSYIKIHDLEGVIQKEFNQSANAEEAKSTGEKLKDLIKKRQEEQQKAEQVKEEASKKVDEAKKEAVDEVKEAKKEAEEKIEEAEKETAEEVSDINEEIKEIIEEANINPEDLNETDQEFVKVYNEANHIFNHKRDLSGWKKEKLMDSQNTLIRLLEIMGKDVPDLKHRISDKTRVDGHLDNIIQLLAVIEKEGLLVK